MNKQTGNWKNVNSKRPASGPRLQPTGSSGLRRAAAKRLLGPQPSQPGPVPKRPGWPSHTMWCGHAPTAGHRTHGARGGVASTSDMDDEVWCNGWRKLPSMETEAPCKTVENEAHRGHEAVVRSRIAAMR
jgi:hypothetical protein